MTPTLFPALQLSQAWTEQADSPGIHGRCSITTGTLTRPMFISFAPVKRPLGQPWDNSYILHRNPFSEATDWDYHTIVTFPTAEDIANCNCYEEDRQDNPGSAIFNWGWQFRFKEGLFIWDRSARNGDGEWEGPILGPNAAIFEPGVPKRIIMSHARDISHVTYLGVAIDGMYKQLNITYPVVDETQQPYTNNAVQLDSLGQGAPINVWLNECNLLGF